MPELPEIETVRRSLERMLLGRRIERINVRLPKQIATHSAEEFRRLVAGHQFSSFGRRGKYLIAQLSGPLQLVVHLRMTGQLLVCSPNEPMDRHVHVVFTLDDGLQLRYRDVRQFGRLYLLNDRPFADQPEAPKGLKELGPEPLDPAFTQADFCARLASHHSMLKALLLRQDIVAGLGNIYVDEALFRARLHPERAADELSSAECQRLYRAVRGVLSEAVRYRGTTFSDFRDGYGRTGAFRERLQAYGREGEPCPRCGTELVRTRVAGRGTRYCPHCQAAPDNTDEGRGS